MTWDYRNFPRHPVAAEKLEIIGINTTPLNYHYSCDPELGRGVCVILQIPCAFPVCIAQLDKYFLPTISPSSQLRYSLVENCYYKYLNITMIGSS